MPTATGNLYAGLPAPGPEEHFATLFANPALRIERIVSDGQASPPGFWYEQAQDEWVVLLAGAATLGFADGSRHALAPGDWIALPAGLRHRVEATAPRSVWLAVHGGRSTPVDPAGAQPHPPQTMP